MNQTLVSVAPVRVTRLGALALSLCLSACGGSSGSDHPSDVADAGTDVDEVVEDTADVDSPDGAADADAESDTGVDVDTGDVGPQLETVSEWKDDCEAQTRTFRLVTLGDVTLHTGCQGAGETLVFLHGFPEFWYAWDPVMRLLADDYRTVAPDQRGFNLSSKPAPEEAYAVPELVDDVVALIDAVSDRPVVLLGHDWGGAVAWAVASRHPEKLRALVIANGPHPNTFVREYDQNPAQREASAYFNFLIAAGSEDSLGAADFAILAGFFDSVLSPEELALYKEAWGQPDALRSMVNWYRANLDDDGRPSFDGEFHVDVPTLVFWGLADTALLPGNLDGLDQYVPDLEIERLEGATHWLTHEQPEVMATRIRQFLDRLAQPRVPNVAELEDPCDGNFAQPDPYPNQLNPGSDLHRYTIRAPGAVCNDGTPAVLYVAPGSGTNANRWIFHAQGGSACAGYEGCLKRWCGVDYYDASKMSSSYCPPTVRGQGIMAPTGGDEPTRVYLYYCSSDGWSGQGSSVLTEPMTGESYSLHRRGHTIIEAAFTALEGGIRSDDGEVELPPLSSASDLLWTGTSAGSNGAQLHADWVSARLGDAVQVRAVFDAAVLPNPVHVPEDVTRALERVREVSEGRIQEDLDYVPFVDQSCAADLGEGAVDCAESSHLVYHRVTTPFFVRMDLQDNASIDRYVAAGMTQDDYAQAVRASLLDLSNLADTATEGQDITVTPGVFGPNCGDHVGLFSDEKFFEQQIGPANYATALSRWLGGMDVSLVDTNPATLSRCQ